MLLADLDITDRLNAFFTELFAWLPRVAGALAILVLGYFLAKLLGRLVTRALQRVGLDGWVQRGFGGSWISRVISRPSQLLGTVSFWIIFIAALSIAVDVLGIAALEDAIRAVWDYVPNVLAALAIFLIAGALAAGVATLVSRTLGTSGMGRILGTVAPVLIMGIAVFMILDQLQIAENIVVITYASLMGAIALGMALAFGLGGRDVAAQMLQGAYTRGQQAIPQVRQDLTRARERAGQQTQQLARDDAPSGPGSPAA
jgi:mechanosensitive ion channel-like protein